MEGDEVEDRIGSKEPQPPLNLSRLEPIVIIPPHD